MSPEKDLKTSNKDWRVGFECTKEEGEELKADSEQRLLTPEI